MKLNQENNSFTPVTITFETREELDTALAAIIELSKLTIVESRRKMAIEISNWISNEAK